MNKILDFMKRNYKLILIVILLAGAFFGFKQRQIAEDKETAILQSSRKVIDYAHYHPAVMNDEFSEQVFDEFIKNLDPSKRFFTQTDIDSLNIFRDKIDDQIYNLSLDFYKKAYEIIKERQEEAMQYIDEALDENFDFSKNETLNLDFDNIPFPKNKEEVKKRWKNYLKSNVLSRVYTKLEEQKKKQKDSAGFVPKSIDELTKEAVKATKKSIKNYKELIAEMEEMDYFSMYMNAIMRQNDPHTNYFSPQTKERFDTSMAGSFDGIGARLQKEGDFVKIIEVIPGGPAWKAGELKAGDIIQKVGQENEKEPLDIMGMRLSKVIKFIKGPKGTTVFLHVKRVDGSFKTIAIERDRVELEETFAKSLLINKDDKEYGYIYLPKFYVNFKERSERRSSTDMKKELEKLKKSGVEGIVIDLRNNGGGSLVDVIDIAGYFINKGAVVQVKDKKGNIEVLKDKNSEVIYDGSVVILINEQSASASEILAAALQDYNRAIIMGSKSYGKGTVQNVIGLNQVYGNEYGDIGALKWTNKKFYRINGGSTQRKGVTPDITMPDNYKYLEVREENEPTALDWDKIKKAKYSQYSMKDKAAIINKAQKQIDAMPIFKSIDEKAKWLSENKEDNTIYLNLDEYTADLQKIDKINTKFDSLIKFKSDLKVYSLGVDIEGKENDTIFKDKRKRWIKALKKDIYIDQAIKVLVQMNKQ
jgi:carboxyl-terminal processing protease